MSDDRILDHDDGRPQAAEYVLGVLGVQERREFERRLATEPMLRGEVEYWEGRLGALASEVVPVEPPARVWARIEQALGPTVSGRGVWYSLRFWRFAAIGSAAVAAAACIALVIGASRAPTLGPALIAKLDVGAGQTGFIAAVDRGGAGLTIVPALAAPSNQRALELWLIAPGEKPRSLGLIEAGKAIHITLPADAASHVATDTTLAVSLEPPGGSPTGQPTGPVIAQGKLTNL